MQDVCNQCEYFLEYLESHHGCPPKEIASSLSKEEPYSTFLVRSEICIVCKAIRDTIEDSVKPEDLHPESLPSSVLGDEIRYKVTSGSQPSNGGRRALYLEVGIDDKLSQARLGHRTGYLFSFKIRPVSSSSSRRSKVEMAGQPPASVSYSCVQTWINACDQSICESSAGRQPLRCGSLRVIDVYDKCLVEIDGSIPFVALSYIWGPDNNEDDKLLLADQHLFYEKGSIGKVKPLARTIRDALEVTAHVGYRYLFVDRLCIIQDSSEDTDRLVGAMDEIYGFASFTIVAAGGRNIEEMQGANTGLVGTHGTPRSLPLLFDKRLVRLIRDRYEFVRVYHDEMAPGDMLLKTIRATPWSVRGWTLQEQLLSRRLLLFTERTVFWKCQHAIMYEGSPWTVSEWYKDVNERTNSHEIGWSVGGSLQQEMAIDDPKIAQPYHSSRAVKSYRILVEQYSKRRLGYPEDIARAFDAIRAGYEKQYSPLKFHFGLPTSNLPTDLAWGCAGCMSDEHRYGHLKPRQSSKGSIQLRFPTWSWFCWQGDVQWQTNTFVETFWENEKAATTEIYAASAEGFVVIHTDARESAFDLGPVEIPSWALSHPRRHLALVFRALVRRLVLRCVEFPGRATESPHPRDFLYLTSAPFSCVGSDDAFKWLQRPSADSFGHLFGVVCIAYVDKWTFAGGSSRIVLLMLVRYITMGEGDGSEVASRDGLLSCDAEVFDQIRHEFLPQFVFLC